MGAMKSSKPFTAPCQEACPAGIDVPGYIRNIRDGHFGKALDVIRARIPFPSVCGYACVHPCETKCSRSQFDEPIAIRMLKRVAAEKGESKQRGITRRSPTGKKIAVVGSGPCGLTAAHYLNMLGHQATVYEKLPLPGGMLRYGIPDYRLPAKTVERDIAFIRNGGVEIITNATVSSAEALQKQGYDAVFVATGAWTPSKLGIPGEESPRVIDGLAFLMQVNEGKRPDIGRKIIVVGGGNTAIDAGRAAIRLGSEVIQLYRRTSSEMPANAEEVSEAIEEGVRIDYLTAPVRIEKNRATCIRMSLGDCDASGRPTPTPIAGSEFQLSFDTLIAAVGQHADATSVNLPGEKDGTVCAEQASLSTRKSGIFAGGDVVTGPSTIIAAIAQGRQACISIDRFLGGAGIIPEFLPEQTDVEPPEESPRGAQRQAVRRIALNKRISTFDTVEHAYTGEKAAAEASRCLSCDLRKFDVIINDLVCKDCGYCQEVCRFDIFQQSADFNPSGYLPAVAVNRDRCVACLRCLYICPDFAITIRERNLEKI
ncbi:MAG: FAD-dependent oxidoreductase [Syntrophobacterales bacterium]|nr:FAD-dependent oxidoreductase [Syntrophobacterales bacterium]